MAPAELMSLTLTDFHMGGLPSYGTRGRQAPGLAEGASLGRSVVSSLSAERGRPDFRAISRRALRCSTVTDAPGRYST
jgi:hypothetical protein